MTREQLMQMKGELTTQIEIAQAKLQQVNNEIVKCLNVQPEKAPEKVRPQDLNGNTQEEPAVA